MKEAFVAGGDFHSRTAMNMYPYIREAVEQNEVTLEWHPQHGQEKPLVPLLKVMTLTQTQLEEVMNIACFDANIVSIGGESSSDSDERVMPLSSISKASPINSLLAGENLQFGAFE